MMTTSIHYHHHHHGCCYDTASSWSPPINNPLIYNPLIYNPLFNSIPYHQSSNHQFPDPFYPLLLPISSSLAPNSSFRLEEICEKNVLTNVYRFMAYKELGINNTCAISYEEEMSFKETLLGEMILKKSVYMKADQSSVRAHNKPRPFILFLYDTTFGLE